MLAVPRISSYHELGARLKYLLATDQIEQTINPLLELTFWNLTLNAKIISILFKISLNVNQLASRNHARRNYSDLFQNKTRLQRCVSLESFFGCCLFVTFSLYYIVEFLVKIKMVFFRILEIFISSREINLYRLNTFLTMVANRPVMYNWVPAFGLL